MMSSIFQRQVVYLVTGIVVAIMFVDFFFFETSTLIAEQVQTWGMVIYNMALGLGAIRLMMSHGKVIQRRNINWQFSAMLIGLFALTFITGLVGYISTGDPQSNGFYDWMFVNPYVSLDTTFYAMTGFYIFSAAYRAFRARNIDSALLLIAGCIVLLTNAPIGEVIWSQIPFIGRWFLDYGQVPAMRTFTIVAAFGMLAYGLRALLGREKGYYGEVAGAK
jgi:hypothetical protein